MVFLTGLLTRGRFRRPLFYLDAHWYSTLPLIEELRTILESIESFVIVIDDFKVPDEVNFGFDHYGNTDVEWKLIERVLVDSGVPMVAYLPAYPSSVEVGDTRGWILISSIDNQQLISQAVPMDLLKVHAVLGTCT